MANRQWGFRKLHHVCAHFFPCKRRILLCGSFCLVLFHLELARLGLLVAATLLFLQNWDRRLLVLVIISGVDSHFGFALLFSGRWTSEDFVSGCGDGCFFLKGWAEECTHLCLWNEWTRTYASGLVDANETRLVLRLFSVAGFLEWESIIGL
jgi:hypothetical protein